MPGSFSLSPHVPCFALCKPPRTAFHSLIRISSNLSCYSITYGRIYVDLLLMSIADWTLGRVAFDFSDPSHRIFDGPVERRSSGEDLPCCSWVTAARPALHLLLIPGRQDVANELMTTEDLDYQRRRVSYSAALTCSCWCWRAAEDGI